MSGSCIVFSGIFSYRERDEHPIVTDDKGQVWLCGGNCWTIIDNYPIRIGDRVEFTNRNSWVNYPKKEQEILDLRTDDYCTLKCPCCKS